MRSYPIRLYPKPKSPALYSAWVICSLVIASCFFIASVLARISIPFVLYGLIFILLVCLWGLNLPYPAPLSRTPTPDRRGFAEYPQNSQILDLLRDFFGEEKIFILRKLRKYTPDFAYVNILKEVYIDIEVDEPYIPRQPASNDEIIPIHYVDKDNIGKDDLRDRFFLKNGWAVIRFSERQILLYPARCCKVIGEMIAELTKEPQILREFEQVPDLESELQWTEEEARRKATDRERLHY
jgi:hypothetical protein